MVSERQTILIVDDEPASLSLLMRALVGSYRVLFARNAGEAMAIALREVPDLIILDVVMPGASGYDLCRQIKKDECLRDIPVIFQTSRRHEADERIGLELGGGGLLDQAGQRRDRQDPGQKPS
jgi:putative two-component system response regulator